VASTAGLVAVTLAVAVLAGPIWDLCVRAATDLLDPSSYVQAVLGP
jgi:multicomponent Na+:H+ antiporter subunit D